MEKTKNSRKLKKLHIDLPKIQNKIFTLKPSEKQNTQSQLNFQLSPQVKDLRKLFFEYKSNARILQKSPYYNNSSKNRMKLVEMISTRRYDMTDQIEQQIQVKYGWIEEQQNSTKDQSAQYKQQIKIKLAYQGRSYTFSIKCISCQQLTRKVTCQLAKIMFSLKNTFKKCDLVLCYQSVQQNHQVDFILSNPKLEITFMDRLHIKPVFHKTQSGDAKISIKDFKFIKCLGNGGFSTVFLVKGNFNNRYYALKLIDKKFIIDSERDGIVENQRYILGELNSPFTTGLEFAFQTKNHFVLVIQYCPGGELFYQLKRVKRMRQAEAKFYFLQILIGLDYVHQKNIVYRDLKPQNLLIGIDGHIKIADFGLSKPMQDKKQLSHSFCGSPEYMAPQMLLKLGHNFLLDYYCLGALLYELVVGVPPYYSLNHEQIYNSILTQQLSFPSHIQLSSELKNLLSGLLQKNHKKRLGSMFGVKQILLHPWVGKIRQKQIENKQLQPPFIPDLQNFNFDLSDIKTDQQAINKKIEEDMMCGGFETHFSEEFTYQCQEFKERVSKMHKLAESRKKQKKTLGKSKSLQNYLSMPNRRAQTRQKFDTHLQVGLKSSKNYLTSRQLQKATSSKGFALTIRK